MTTSSSDADWRDPALISHWWAQPFEKRVETVARIVGQYDPAKSEPNALDASLSALEALEREVLGFGDDDADPINHPTHYAAGWSNGAEVIDITENLNFNRGNAVKYLARAGRKNPEAEIEDLKKAAWYLQREIDRLVWA